MNNGHFPRVILFDIDGTLIRAVRRGQYRGLIRAKIEGIFGTCGRIGEVEFAGKTDLAIYREALECEGIGPELIRRKIPDIEDAMSEILELMASEGGVFALCPGVRELLAHLQSDARFVTALLTGNMELLAERKLRLAGIWDYFKVRGAFGSDDEERNHLPAIAAARISEHLGAAVSPDRMTIIGDTPRDILCAKHFGARVLAVASGQHSMEQLTEYRRDRLVPDLSDTEAVVEILAQA